MAKNVGYENISRNYSGGVARYGYNLTPLQKELRDSSNEKNREAIDALKKQLRDEVEDQRAQRSSIFRRKDNPKENNPVIMDRKILRAKNADEKQTNNNIERIIARLASFGVETKRDKTGRVSFKTMKEGGNQSMEYNVTKLKQMKLETFQESAAGTITNEAAGYLLKYFDIMIEAAEAGDLNELVTDYVAACKAGDESKKEGLKEKISAAADCKKAKADLESLKDTLSDEEKKFVEELDSEICGGENDDDDDAAPTEESGEDGENCGWGRTTTKDVKDVSGKPEELGKKAASAANKAGTDNKGAFEELLSAAAESTGISDIGRGALLDYVTEAVAAGEMDTDVATALASLATI